MRYPESVEYLYKLGNEIRSAKFGLEGIRTLVDALGGPQRAFRGVHVAGTNGKGSTCAMIEAGLRAAGLRTGLYTSPHLIEPAERIRINGAPITREQFSQSFDRIHEVNLRLIDGGRLDHHTTYFETVTAMGFDVFKQQRVDIAVVEVGLGGRLDATNIVTPEVTVITRVDFDHEQFLGHTLEAIAAEKAGILKPGVPLILAPQRPEADAVIRARAAELGITVHDAAPRDVAADPYGCEFTTLDGLRIRCPLAGEHQAENAATAVEALRVLGHKPEIGAAEWPGRLQRIHDRPGIILDGAHNPSGVRALARHIERFYGGRDVHLVFGAMRDKSIQQMVELLFPLAGTVTITCPSNPRAAPPETIAAMTTQPAVQVVADPAEALRRARLLPPESVVFVAGSLYLVGEVLASLVE